MGILLGFIAILGSIFCFYVLHCFADEWSDKVGGYFGLFAIFLFIVGGLSIWGGIGSLMSPHHSSEAESSIQLGHKINKSKTDEDDSGAYYTDKDDSKLRYFTSGDSNKVTAAKYVYGADHMNVTDVKNKLSDVVLHDDNLKYTDDKTDSDDFLPKGNSFNVYSPKNKKWYHVSMQRDSSDEDAKVSSFSIWPGKDNDVDDY